MCNNIIVVIVFLIFIPSVCDGISNNLENSTGSIGLHSNVEKYQNIISQNPQIPFEDMLETTKGKDIDYMTDRFGYPSRDFLGPNKNRVFEYNFSQAKKDKTLETLFSGMADASLGGIPFFSTLNKLDSNYLDCTFWFEVNKKDFVRKWRWQGKDCEEIYKQIEDVPKSLVTKKDLSASVSSDESTKKSEKFLFGELQISITEKEIGTNGLYPQLGAHILIKRGNKIVVDKTPKIEGDLYGSWVTDLDEDQNPEICLWTRDFGSGGYGKFTLYDLYENTLLKYEVPQLTKEQKEGYMGHDQFELSPKNIIRKYKIYMQSDPNCCPTGGTMELVYSYNGIRISLEKFSRLD